MARSVLNALVNGTRQVLTAQLFISVAAVALAGWTLAITNDLIRERDRLRDRVIQLEQAMASGGVVVPATPVLVDQPQVRDANAYPGEVGLRGNLRQGAIEVTASPAPATRVTRTAESAPANFSRVLTGLFAPPPPVQIVVMHVRAQPDLAKAQEIGADLIRAAHVRVILRVLPAGDARLPGYAYFDGRQSSGAATLVAQFNDIARAHDVAPWSAQLRGTALPATGEYGAERIDLVLPPLPQPAPPPLLPPVTQEPTTGAATTPAQTPN